ncbi:metabolite traffic protein EboE [Kineosporia sp. J2-2]|uniref:Metabolite traffic protein EboE n=1 Tax=Kineosporia corallincola TaxID=2835133 RepID=A0ABS5T930_9ACTN|nr:metabolite traffic protein EboE [Kineosporia corallincola]MBT0767584.1 metabolite traffic protein EboE [Kineosporia corallincola]
MRFRHRDGSVVHLSYCTNMHPAEDLEGILAQLHTFAGPVRRGLGWPVLGVGLWLPAPAARHLASDRRALDLLRRTLTAEGLEVVTLNGFPYRSFQADVVKGAVYRPDWLERERLDYTLDLAAVLHRLLPPDAASGSISTLPFGWRTRFPGGTGPADAAMVAVATELQSLAGEFGRPVRLAVEPEPGCVVETLAGGLEAVARLGVPEWIGMCLDACHLATQFEDASVTGLLDVHQVGLYKTQVSNALRVIGDDRSWLADFAEPRFLHQVRQEDGHGEDDLDEATMKALDPEQEWRVHYHMPLDRAERTTQPELRDTLKALVGGDRALTTHLDVETYTWSVLPGQDRPLVEAIAGELGWTAAQLERLGLEPVR